MMRFPVCPPSTAWEAISLHDAPTRFVWAWFRPPAATEGVFVQVPDETYLAAVNGPPLTLRGIAWSLGMDPVSVSYLSLYGMSYDGGQGTNPVWDYSLSDPGAVPDRTIGLFCSPQAARSFPVAAPMSGQVAPDLVAADAGDCFARMHADWHSSLLLEIQLASAGLQLKGTLARVTALNRDLTSEEARFAEQRDKMDWQDARRWLRDVADRVSRFLKDYQTGDTSIAGKRSHYEYLYENYVVPQRVFQGLEQAAREFETHRKSLQTLLSNMSTAQNAANQDGERRAQQILQRMAAKTRSARTKR